jgi:cysteinyl-tRNA synthetase
MVWEMLKVYNTLSRSKEEFKPLNENTVRMYVCGPTVYDYPHIGNARSFAVFDTIRRYLEFKGYHVFYVTNFTDIDDKMIKRANEQNIEVQELAEKFISEYLQIADELNLKPASVNPRATEHMDDIISMVKSILDRGVAYTAKGDVYFDISEWQNYGVLSKIDPDELAAGARVEADEKKDDPRDFVLWKEKKPGEPSWDSPWGEGRPGWHMECSVMGAYYLGIPFDIHGGGQDLIFPHHENEIAQSAAAYGVDTPVKYWLHNGFLTINEDKMSKSEGNFFTAREVLDNYDNQGVRFFLVSGHYRQPLDYNDQALKQATQSVERIRNAIDAMRGRITILSKKTVNPTKTDNEIANAVELLKSEFEKEMDDDFNTPGAIAAVFSFIRTVNANLEETGKAAVLREALAVLSSRLEILGIDVSKKELAGSSELRSIVEGSIELLLEIRERAREKKDYETGDMIRDRLASLRVAITDTKDGSTWKIES